MTNLRLKSVHSPDVEINVWQPGLDGVVYFLLELEIAETGDERADIFQVVVATPEGLRMKAPNGPVLSKRATIVLSCFSWEIVTSCLERILVECSSQNWNDAVLRLQRFFQWEYEDFVQE